MSIAYLAAANAVNVKSFRYQNVNYSAAGNGTIDDSSVFEKALKLAGDNNVILYIPNGTYKISKSLFAKNTAGNWYNLKVQGQSESKTILKLVDNALGFTTSGSYKALITFGCEIAPSDVDGSGNSAFNNSLVDITIDIGSGNMGAVGVEYLANNVGSIRRVTIKSSGPADAAVRMWRYATGPALIKNCTFNGFKNAIRAKNFEYGITIDSSNFFNQTDAAIWAENFPITISNCQGYMNVPFAKISNHCHFVAKDCFFTTAPGSSVTIVPTAIETYADNSQVTLDNVSIQGNYQYAVRENEYNSKTTAKGVGINYASAGYQYLHTPSAPYKKTFECCECIQLPHNPSDSFKWKAVPNSLGSYFDNTANIQAALNDTNAEVVYFPSGQLYYIYETLIVPPHIKRIVGNFATLRIGDNSDFATLATRKPIFLIADGSEHLTIDTISIDAGYQNAALYADVIWNSSNRPLSAERILGLGRLVSAPSARSILDINDCCFALSINSKTVCYAWQLNLESGTTEPITKIVNDGGELYVVGIKSEGSDAIIENKNGAISQIFGSLLYPAQPVSPDTVMALNEDNSILTLVVCGGASNSDNNMYKKLVEQTWNGTTQSLNKSSLSPLRMWTSPFLSYYSGTP